MTVEDKLEREVEDARRTISTDGYPMSIGELTNLYRDGELVIRPEFQRFFRWKSLQKSRLVESLLLSIPLPSIFVAQTESGIWEVVDGLQRISTIMELQGELLKDGVKQPQLKLIGTKYLPSLEGRQWQHDEKGRSLNEAERLDIKRSKVDLKILKRDSSSMAKYDLFQRLNSYGSSLNAQEMRSALLVAASPQFFSWIEGLSRHSTFVSTVALSESLIEERYDLELVTRFLVLHDWPEAKLKLTSLRDLPQILDDASISMAEQFPARKDALEAAFKGTFDIVAANGGEDIFRRWDAAKGGFRGPFLNSSFEIFALGLGYRIATGKPYRSDLVAAAKELWTRKEMQSGFSTGRSTESRLIDFIPVGRNITAPT